MRFRNRKAAEAAVRMHYDEIFAYVLRQIPQRETALDLTQDIFVSMLRSIDSYDDKKASLRTWLYRIATNRVIDHIRSRAFRQERASVPLHSLPLEDDHDFVAAMLSQETMRELLFIAEQLPVEQQKVLRMKLLASRNFREIAEALSLPESTVKTRYYAAIRHIRKIWKEQNENG